MNLSLIKPTLYQRAEKIAREQSAGIADVLNTALQHYFWELDRCKVAEESAHYRYQHKELKKDYLGQYIAMHNGEVVDHDKDFERLRVRIHHRLPDVAVMITLVTEEATPTLERRGFRIEGNV